ncbi:unnamed protein product [Spirodela intermedia]|uniref:Uncharacterized protein n=2 Tax=Spirodela intermedia TaxID=51605 RepID=A0A7I8JKU4_SPIIN|nr:unnamed protein product [Spirodela intermedia]CAA6670092.1 unnamed protein product [Spirodela intermedia]CAA7407140.1 unnamed protein product [Spirodela intermedia]
MMQFNHICLTTLKFLLYSFCLSCSDIEFRWNISQHAQSIPQGHLLEN